MGLLKSILPKYVPVNWVTGEVITADKLNRSEQGIVDLENQVDELKDDLNKKALAIGLKHKIIPDCFIASNGTITSDSTPTKWDVHCYPVNEGMTIIKMSVSADSEQLVWGYFTNEPSLGSVTYDGNRAGMGAGNVTAENVLVPMGVSWIGFRAKHGDSPTIEFVDVNDISNISAQKIVVDRETATSRDGVTSLNGNLLKLSDVKYTDKFINTSNGVLTDGEGYSCGYVNIPVPGVYTLGIASAALGTSRLKLPLFDGDYHFIKSITGTAVNNYVVQFTIDNTLPTNAVYIGFSYRPGSDVIPMLIRGEYPADTTYTEPVYGFTTNKLLNKVLVCDGDSICQASLDNPLQMGGWFGRFVKNYRMSGANYADGGGTITDKTDTTVGGDPRHSVAISIDTIASEYTDLDYLILDGGTNDADLIGQFDGDTPPEGFGTWSDSDFSGSYNKQTFCGAVDYMFYKAVTTWPTAKIGFIIVMEMGTNNSTVANRRRYMDEIVKIANKWHVPVLDLWNNIHSDARLTAYYDSSLTVEQNVAAGKFYNDGQHPTSYGYNFMQPMIEAWAESL